MHLPAFLIIYLVAALADSVGFIKSNYFVTFGYTLSVFADALTILIMYKGSMGLITTILTIVIMIYSARLGIYIYLRGKKESYQNKIKDVYTGNSNMSFSAMCPMWLGCALIYACEVAPILFRVKNGTSNDLMLCLGFLLSTSGAVIESLADQQKYNAKKVNPTSFVSTGLYQIVRCPNYLGEILVWTGVFVSGIPAYRGFWQWSAALFGYVCITFVMLAAARTLEIRQNKSYGEDEKYQKYIKTTPILIPGFPI